MIKIKKHLKYVVFKNISVPVAEKRHIVGMRNGDAHQLKKNKKNISIMMSCENLLCSWMKADQIKNKEHKEKFV